MKKTLLIIGLIALVGVGGYFGYKKLSEGTFETSNWKTYSNSTWGFSFKYPNTWKLEEITDSKDFLSLSLTMEDTTQDQIEVYMDKMYPMYTIQVMARPNAQDITAKAEYESQFINPPDEEITPVTYGNLKGIRYYEPVAPSSGKNPAVMLTDGKSFYIFIHSALATEKTHTKYFDTFEKVLKTLKFEEQTAYNPKEVVTMFTRATLGMIPGALIDYDLAQTLLTKDLKAKWTSPMFIPALYGIQDGPEKVDISTQETGKNTATVEVLGYWGGDPGKTWVFSLVKEGNEWLIKSVD